jgi:hypothetical protein
MVKSMNDQKQNLFKVMVDAAVKGSEAMAEDYTSWRKPIVRAFFYFGTFFVMLLALPFLIPYKIFGKKLIDPFDKMRTELETIWRTESSNVALEKLRNVYFNIISELDAVMLKGLEIDPYGKFRFDEYLKVSHLLYHWELQHQNWDMANNVCDDILKYHHGSDPKRGKPFAEWIVLKARVLNNLEGNKSAQEYLLKYIDPEEKESPIKKYLYELRKAS